MTVLLRGLNVMSLLAVFCHFMVSASAWSQDYVPGEVIVKLRSQSHSKNSYAFLGKMNAMKGMHLKQSWDAVSTYHFQLSKSGETVEQAVEELRRDSEVEYAEPNYYLNKTNNTGMQQTYTYSDVQQMAQSTSYLATGANIGVTQFWASQSVSAQAATKPVVAVIDTGLDLNHPVISATSVVWTNTGEVAGNGIDDDGNGYIDDVHGWNFVDNSGSIYDDDGHGTHVSGIILSVDQNIYAAPYEDARIRIMPLKFLDGNGSGTTSNAIKAIYYAVNNGATVLNNSWGGTGYSTSLLEAIAYSYQRGVSFVAAAGNSTKNNDSTPLYPASYNVPNIIAVAATNDLDYLASFSNYGALSVDLGSPGVFILSTIPGGGYGSSSGTSMSTPFVAGTAIQMKVESPSMLGYQIREIILSQVNTFSQLNNKVYTAGRLNSSNAINYSKTASVYSTQPAYTMSLGGDRELASSLAGSGGCGIVSKMKSSFGDGEGGGGSPSLPETWYVLVVLGILLLPVIVSAWLRSQSPENRRRYERFRINSDVRIHLGDKELVGSVSSISLGGAQINTQALLENGGIVAMTISSPDGKEKVQVEGRVVWSEAKKAYGVAFESAPHSVLSRISMWTRTLQKSG